MNSKTKFVALHQTFDLAYTCTYNSVALQNLLENALKQYRNSIELALK